MVYNWPEFKTAFLNYIRTTPGLFTLRDDVTFPYFNLDAFLKQQCINADMGRQNSITQIEMLMSLACFIDIGETHGLVSFDTFPTAQRGQFKTLIQLNLIQLAATSLVKKNSIEFMIMDTVVVIGAAAAA